jgi:hypothetical protein
VDAPEGISIAVYAAAGKGYAVVDDRRAIEVTGRRVLLDRIDRSAALPTLVIEPLGVARGALVIEQCARERLRAEPAAVKVKTKAPDLEELAGAAEAAGPDEGMASPLVACTVRGKPGRYRVRVHYVAAAAPFLTKHEIEMTAPDRATVSTRFAVSMPAWGARGEVVLHEGVPGAGDPPREIGRGPATFDGGTAVIALPPREVPARLVRVFDGMQRTALVDRTDAAWGKDSHHEVRLMLELDDEKLLAGPAHVRLAIGGEVHELSTAYTTEEPLSEVEKVLGATAAEPVKPASTLTRRLPLGSDPLLRGLRRRTIDPFAGASLADRLELSVANMDSEPREVWIEEPLRPAKKREITRARPAKPEIAGDIARHKVTVAPGQIERLGFTVRYTF